MTFIFYNGVKNHFGGDILEKNLFGFLIIVCLLIHSHFYPSQAFANMDDGPKEEQLKAVEAFVAEQFKEADIVGGSYAIVYQDKIISSKGLGYSDLKTKKQATAETVYAIASITKSLTATAILQLQEKGKLSINDPVQNYLPWFTYANKEKSKRVTIEHLLTQSAGVSRYKADGSIYENEKKNRDSIESAIKALRTVPMNAEPGEKGQYCNTCYNTLGLLIEKTSGKSYYEYMESSIFDTLKMDNTVYGKNLDQLNNVDIAKEYSWFFGFRTDRFLNYKTFGRSQDPEGGIYTNVIDLAKYVSAVLGYSENKLLSSNVQHSMFEGKVLSEQSPWQYTTGSYTTGEIAGEKVVYKGGDGIGSSSGIMLMPKKELGIVLITGEPSDIIFDIGSGLVEILAGDNPGPIKHSADFFQMAGFVMLAVTIISFIIVIMLASSIYRRYKVKGRKIKRRWVQILASLILLAITSILIYILFAARLTQAGFYGFPLDWAIGIGSLAMALLLSTLYYIYLSIFGTVQYQSESAKTSSLF